MNKVPLTRRGAEKLREELRQLKNVERPRIVEAIAEARSHGDLRENAEFKAAKERQAFVEARLNHLTQRMTELSKIDVNEMAYDRVGFGSTVKILDVRPEQVRLLAIQPNKDATWVGDEIDFEAVTEPAEFAALVEWDAPGYEPARGAGDERSRPRPRPRRRGRRPARPPPRPKP